LVGPTIGRRPPLEKAAGGDADGVRRSVRESWECNLNESETLRAQTVNASCPGGIVQRKRRLQAGRHPCRGRGMGGPAVWPRQCRRFEVLHRLPQARV